MQAWKSFLFIYFANIHPAAMHLWRKPVGLLAGHFAYLDTTCREDEMIIYDFHGGIIRGNTQYCCWNCCDRRRWRGGGGGFLSKQATQNDGAEKKSSSKSPIKRVSSNSYQKAYTSCCRLRCTVKLQRFQNAYNSLRLCITTRLRFDCD